MKKKSLLVLSVAALAACGLASCSGGEKEFVDNATALGTTKEALQEAVLGTYDAKYKAGAAITDPSKTDERYKAFAQAEYSLIYEEGIVLPWYAQNGVYDTVSRTVARQAGKASYGLTSDKFKNVIVSTDIMTKEKRALVDAKYEAEKATPAIQPDAEGWTALTNQHQNGAIDAQGNYTYGATFKTKKTFNTTYTKEPDKAFLNYLTNSWTYNSYHYCNMVDGLVENDKYGNIVGSVADKYKVENLEGGKQKWSFHIRDGVTWVNNKTGAKVADVVADDFVAGAQYVLTKDNGSNTAGIVYGFIDGAYEYYKGQITDFSKVGVKAESTNVISYTLKEVTPYFISSLTYSPFLPVNRAFLEGEGSNFGISEDHLLVNGAFRITKHVDQKEMEYTKNATYWDKDHVYVDTVHRQFIPGTETSKDIRLHFENGETDSFTVNAKDAEGWAKYITGPQGTGTQKNPYAPECVATTSFGTSTYIGYFNFNRSFWEVTGGFTQKTYAEKLATAKALLSKNFRLAFLYGLKVDEYLKQISPTEPYNYIMRGYTNRELVYCGGKDYADYVEDVYNEKKGTSGVRLAGINNGSDPIYNAAKSTSYFLAAKDELIKSGALTEADFPIKIDVIGNMDVEAQAFEKAQYQPLAFGSNGVCEIRYVVPETEDQDTDWGSISNNYDFSVWSGWGPDYADPNTFLHTMCINGDMVEQLGF